MMIFGTPGPKTPSPKIETREVEVSIRDRGYLGTISLNPCNDEAQQEDGLVCWANLQVSPDPESLETVDGPSGSSSMPVCITAFHIRSNAAECVSLASNFKARIPLAFADLVKLSNPGHLKTLQFVDD